MRAPYFFHTISPCHSSSHCRLGRSGQEGPAFCADFPMSFSRRFLSMRRCLVATPSLVETPKWRVKWKTVNQTSRQTSATTIRGGIFGGGFAAACLQAIAKGGSSILGRPGQTRAMSRDSTTRRPVHTLTTVEGAAVFVPPRTPRSSGYNFVCTCGLCCYMLHVYYMLYACYMPSSESSSGRSGSVWIYIRAIFGKQNWLCA
jgi:hypothetical protein